MAVTKGLITRVIEHVAIPMAEASGAPPAAAAASSRYAPKSSMDVVRRGRRSTWTTEPMRRGLEAAFEQQPFPSQDLRISLAQQCGATLKQISQWFTARRFKEKHTKRNHHGKRPAEPIDDEQEDEGEPTEEEEEEEDDDEMRRAAPAAPSAPAAPYAPDPPGGYSADALRVPLGDAKDLLAIEHPCYVVNVEKGIRMLGGTLTVARASAREPECIECSLRPDDPLAHPLFGVRVPTPGVLLKVTRRKRRAEPGSADAASSSAAAGSSDSAAGGGELSVEVVGKVSSSYRFTGLADYQYVSHPDVAAALDPSARPAGEPFDALRTLDPMAAHAMSIPPSYFSLYDTPLEYMPRSKQHPLAAPFVEAGAGAEMSAGDRAAGSSAKRPGALGASKAPRRKRAKRGNAAKMHFGERVEFDAPRVPSGPPAKVAATVDPFDDMYKAMKAKFSQRPVWSRQALRASLSSELFLSDERLRFRLPQLAYYFSAGPWRHCWIAFGYDPRAHRDARIYQVLDMRLPSEVEHLVPKKSERRRVGAPARIHELDRASAAAGGAAASSSVGASSSAMVVAGGAAGAGGEGGGDFGGRDVGSVPGDCSLPTQRHVYFQMCDFKGEAVVQLVHEDDASSDRAARCHKLHGWYSQAKMEKLRRLVKQSMLQLAHQADGVPAEARPSHLALLAPRGAVPDAEEGHDTEEEEEEGELNQEADAELRPAMATVPDAESRAAAMASTASVSAADVAADSFGIFDDVGDEDEDEVADAGGPDEEEESEEESEEEEEEEKRDAAVVDVDDEEEDEEQEDYENEDDEVGLHFRDE